MPAALGQYDYIFAITTVFAFLDAWNIGANDVANSFATSIASRSLTMKQAMAIACVTEVSGSLAVGSRVADTIRTKIVDPRLFDGHPAVLLLAMMCTLAGSSIFLTVATRNGFPVSTTHSILGGLLGAATASVGIGKVNWGIEGVSQVFLAWVVAPGIAGILGAALFMFTKAAILVRHHAVRNAVISIPVYTFITIGSVTMLVTWKGVQVGREPTATEILISVFSVSVGCAMLVTFFLLPYLWRRIMMEDWPLKWYSIWRGPWLLRRPPPPPTPPGMNNKLNIKDYYHGHLTPEELAYVRASNDLLLSVQGQQGPNSLDKDDHLALPPPAQAIPADHESPHRRRRRRSLSVLRRQSSSSDDCVPPRPVGPWSSCPVILWKVNRILLRGLEKDVVRMQKRNAVLKWDIEDMHARAPHYDNRAEYMYSALQVLTAAAASFVHGANDVANSIAPLATAYEVWREGVVREGVGVPLWILGFGGGSIALGLLTYGYHVIRNLGNRLTLISPSRGFCMELASAITVLMATRLALPVSTTQCITGATVGVGLANGDWRCINPRLVAFIYLGWLITLPVTALISGCLMALILNAPRWVDPTLPNAT